MKKTLLKIAIGILCIVMACISLIPFMVLLKLAFNTPMSLTDNSFFNVGKVTADNFANAFAKSNLLRGMINSAIITFWSLLLTVLFSASASYEIARFPSKLNKMAYGLFIFSMAIPTIICTVPLYIFMRHIGAINTLWGMILLNTATSMPFAVFLYTSFIKTMSRDVEEAARIDGCTWFSAFWRILFPVLKPITSTVILLNAITFWNEYGKAVFFLQKQNYYTIPLSISTFIQKYSANWELMSAAALVAMVPAVAVFLSFQKYYIKGLSAGAVKG